jgi:hypothetical protein
VNRSFTEMLAAFLGVCLVAACLRGRGAGQVALWAFLSSLSKESSFPFLAVLGGVSLLARDLSEGSLRIRFARERARALGLAGGLGLGAAASAALNLFRFGVPYNASSTCASRGGLALPRPSSSISPRSGSRPTWGSSSSGRSSCWSSR